jgi:regulator of RNase E activity RraA
VYAFNESNWALHEQIQNVNENEIVLVQEFNCKNRALLGDIVSKYLLLYKRAAALVVEGYIRDAPRLLKENWPIWCKGFSPIGCFNDRIEENFDEEILVSYKQKYHGAIAVCDDTGVVIIPKKCHNEEFMRTLEAIEELEDIWYECIDRRKWTTFDTICLKKYDKNS